MEAVACLRPSETSYAERSGGLHCPFAAAVRGAVLDPGRAFGLWSRRPRLLSAGGGVVFEGHHRATRSVFVGMNPIPRRQVPRPAVGIA